MDILEREGNSLLARWKSERTPLRVELLSGNVSTSLHGIVAEFSSIEVVIVGETGRLSASLFFAEYKLLYGKASAETHPQWAGRYPVLQILTDGGAHCTLYEATHAFREVESAYRLFSPCDN